jgi:hypothetical protein
MYVGCGPKAGGTFRIGPTMGALEAAAVDTVIKAMPGEEVVTFTADGEIVQPMVKSEGVQPKDTLPLKPATEVTVRVAVPD